LKQTIPGCDELVKLSDTEMNGKVTARVGPVAAKFAGKVTLSDINPPESYTIFGEGQGGVAGFAKGGAKVSLAEDGPNATVLTYVADAQVGGKLAQIGSRLIQSTATVMANQFFSRFAEAVAQSNASPAPASAPPASAPAASAEPLPPNPSVEAQMAAGAAPIGAPAASTTTTATVTAGPGPAAAVSRGGVSPTMWITGLVILVAIVLAVFALR
jgi:hypothetical protein